MFRQTVRLDPKTLLWVPASVPVHRTHNTLSPLPKVGETVELECCDIAFGGDGIAKIKQPATDQKDYVIFVPRTMPGEKFTAKITSIRQSFARATKITSLSPHANATPPPCQYFTQHCGGCSFQSLEYKAQLSFKERQVKNLMQRIGGLALTPSGDNDNKQSIFKNIVPCPDDLLYRYRNKMEFSFGKNTNSTSSSRSLGLGLHLPGSRDEVLSISECMLQTTKADAILQHIHKLCTEHKLSAAGSSTHAFRSYNMQHVQSQKSTTKQPSNERDILHHVAIRYSTASSSYLINFTTNRDARKELKSLAKDLLHHSEMHEYTIDGIVNSVAVPGRPVEERRIAQERVIVGKGFLVERVCGIELEISANAFFQVNTRQADVLYGLVKTAAAVQSHEIALDLFTGSGSIALLLAKDSCQHVYGVDISPASIQNAESNARRNNIDNATFICGHVEELIPMLEKEIPAAHVVVVDPARSGLGQNVIDFLCSAGDKDDGCLDRIVYVSCDPATQARDIKLLSRVFDVVSIQPVDMMPQGPHIECIVVLRKRGRSQSSS